MTTLVSAAKAIYLAGGTFFFGESYLSGPCDFETDPHCKSPDQFQIYVDWLFGNPFVAFIVYTFFATLFAVGWTQIIDWGLKRLDDMGHRFVWFVLTALVSAFQSVCLAVVATIGLVGLVGTGWETPLRSIMICGYVAFGFAIEIVVLRFRVKDWDRRTETSLLAKSQRQLWNSNLCAFSAVTIFFLLAPILEGGVFYRIVAAACVVPLFWSVLNRAMKYADDCYNDQYPKFRPRR